MTNRLTTGTLACQVTPAGGTPLTLSTTLQDLNGQYIYRMIVPFESRMAGLNLSAGVLELLPAGGSFQRQFSVNGTNASFVIAGQASFTFAPPDRARQERVDLLLSTEETYATWSMRYFGIPDADPTADPDHDGMTNFQEFLAGMDPTDALSVFRFVTVRRDAQPGVFLQWASATNKSYSLLRAPNLFGSYTVVASNLVATPPVNSFQDTNVAGIGRSFYRLLVE